MSTGFQRKYSFCPEELWIRRHSLPGPGVFLSCPNVATYSLWWMVLKAKIPRCLPASHAILLAETAGVLLQLGDTSI